MWRLFVRKSDQFDSALVRSLGFVILCLFHICLYALQVVARGELRRRVLQSLVRALLYQVELVG